MRAQCEDIRETKWSKRADTLNSFSFETPTGKRYSARDVNLYKSVILMIAIKTCFVVVVVVVLSLSLSLSKLERKPTSSSSSSKNTAAF